MSDRGEAAAVQCLLALEAMAARVRTLEAQVAVLQGLGKPRVAPVRERIQRNPHGASDAQMELARRMRAERHKLSTIFHALNAVPDGKPFRDVTAVKNFVQTCRMPLGDDPAPGDARWATRHPYGISDAQMALARQMRADGASAKAMLRALNEIPGGVALRDGRQVYEVFRVARSLPGPVAGQVDAKRDTSVGQAVCGDRPAPQGHVAGETVEQSSCPPTVAKPAVATDHGLPVASAILNRDATMLQRVLPEPPHGEASWGDCIIYCNAFGLRKFDGDMLPLNRHREKNGRAPWVLVQTTPPRAAAAPQVSA